MGGGGICRDSSLSKCLFFSGKFGLKHSGSAVPAHWFVTFTVHLLYGGSKFSCEQSDIVGAKTRAKILGQTSEKAAISTAWHDVGAERTPGAHGKLRVVEDNS